VKTLVLAVVALLLGLIVSACASVGDGPNTSATSRGIETPEQAYWGGVLKQLRIESGEFATQALQAWARMENTKAQWNPLATTLKKPGSSDFNSAGVKNYPDQATGIQATADTILYSPSGSGSYYKAIQEMLSQESFNRQELQVALNKWSGNGPYVPGLLDQWAALWSEKVAKESTEAAAPVASVAKPVAPIAAAPAPSSAPATTAQTRTAPAVPPGVLVYDMAHGRCIDHEVGTLGNTRRVCYYGAGLLQRDEGDGKLPMGVVVQLSGIVDPYGSDGGFGPKGIRVTYDSDPWTSNSIRTIIASPGSGQVMCRASTDSVFDTRGIERGKNITVRGTTVEERSEGIFSRVSLKDCAIVSK
jgi:hypothetical protein